MRYYEDIAVGETAAFGRYQVTREEVVGFAARYDPQPFHLDEEAAAATHFGRISASGWHTASMTMRMLVEWMAASKLVTQGSPGVEDLRWPRPVHPDDVLRVEQEVIAKRRLRKRRELGLVTVRTVTLNQDDAPVMQMTSKLLVNLREPGSDAPGEPA